MNCRPSAIMPPQVGVSDETERPTKDRIASTMTAMPISRLTSANRPGRHWAGSPHQDMEPRKADGARGGDVVGLRLRHGFGAHDAAEARPVDDGDRRDDRSDAGAEHGDQQDREQHRRKGHPDFDEPRDHAVDPAAIPAGEQPERRARKRCEARRDEGDDQRDARAVDQAREHVAAEIVGAEPMARLGAVESRGGSGRASGPGRAGSSARSTARRARHDQQQDEAAADRRPSVRRAARADAARQGSGRTPREARKRRRRSWTPRRRLALKHGAASD